MNPDHVYYLVYRKQRRNSAGFKAPDDIAEICRRAGYQPLYMPEYTGKEGTLYQKFWLLTAAGFSWLKNTWNLPRNAVIIYQHPAYGMRLTMQFIKHLRKTKRCRFIAVIHDLESLRGGIRGVITNYEKTYQIGDNALLKSFDAVICHNRKMAAYLETQGFPPEKLIPLELFDYLTDKEPGIKTRGKEPSVAFAGFLAPGKSGFLYRLYENGHNAGLKEYLFGHGLRTEDVIGGMIYKGSFLPSELPALLEGDFGLVWDGVSAETCAGNTGEYLKYNNPHKTSLYLAAGMPVVVWSHAAIADFVLSNGVGITVDSLDYLEKTILEVGDEEYLQMCDRARKLSEKLRAGGFFQTALSAAIKCCDLRSWNSN